MSSKKEKVYELQVKFIDGYISTNRYHDFNVAKYNLNCFINKIGEDDITDVNLSVKEI